RRPRSRGPGPHGSGPRGSPPGDRVAQWSPAPRAKDDGPRGSGTREGGTMTSATQQPEPLFTEISARRLGPVRTFFAQRPVVMDVLIMVLFAFPALVTSFSSPETDPEIPGSGPSEAQMLTALAFVALTTTALFWRRRRPVATLVAVTSLTVLSA